MSWILHSGICDGGSYGSAHEIPLSHNRFCSIALDFGNELCSPRVTTFAECSGEEPWCHNVSGRCLPNASVRSRRHFELSVWSGYQLPLSGSTVWRSRSLVVLAWAPHVRTAQFPLLALSCSNRAETRLDWRRSLSLLASAEL